MPERVRSVVAELYRLMVTKNLPLKQAARVPIIVSLANRRSHPRGETNPIFGITRDLSGTGISFVVSSVKLGDRHLFCDVAPELEVRINLPGGSVRMIATAVRYDVCEDEPGFLVGARVIDMGEEDRACYLNFLRDPPRKAASRHVLRHGGDRASTTASASPSTRRA